METDIKVIIHWVSSIKTEGINLTDWEESFIESIYERLERYGEKTILSDRQIQTIEKIYADKTP